eukprot:scaffold626_cov60-Phaeocystis_antarctica.AAC.5
MSTDRPGSGLEHEEILCRFLSVLGRFVACYADSATENAKLLLPNDVRVTLIENPHPGPRASPEKRVNSCNARVTLV